MNSLVVFLMNYLVHVAVFCFFTSTMHLHEPFTYIVSGYPIINREGKSHFFNRNASFQKCQIYFKSFVHGFSKLHFFQNLKLSVRLTYLIWLVGRHLGWSIARSFNHKLVIWWGSFRMMWYQPEWTSSYLLTYMQFLNYITC